LAGAAAQPLLRRRRPSTSNSTVPSPKRSGKRRRAPRSPIRSSSPRKNKRGNALLFLDEFTENFDSNGNFTGATDVFGEAESGVSFSVAGQLSSATASATVPVTSCSYDADFNLIGCSDAGTVDVSANWTGEGPIARGTFNQNFHQDGFHEVDHFTGTDRQATATATVDGTSLGTGDLLFADLGTAVSGTVIICHNC
jgi:hypothetical protein